MLAGLEIDMGGQLGAASFLRRSVVDVGRLGADLGSVKGRVGGTFGVALGAVLRFTEQVSSNGDGCATTSVLSLLSCWGRQFCRIPMRSASLMKTEMWVGQWVAPRSSQGRSGVDPGPMLGSVGVDPGSVETVWGRAGAVSGPPLGRFWVDAGSSWYSFGVEIDLV